MRFLSQSLSVAIKMKFLLISFPNRVPKNQRSVVYCTAMRHGTADDWDFLYKQYRKANVAAEQTTILSALGCSQDIVVLEK